MLHALTREIGEYAARDARVFAFILTLRAFPFFCYAWCIGLSPLVNRLGWTISYGILVVVGLQTGGSAQLIGMLQVLVYYAAVALSTYALPPLLRLGYLTKGAVLIHAVAVYMLFPGLLFSGRDSAHSLILGWSL